MDKKKSINIGILVSGFPPEVLAGAEIQAQRTAEQLARRGHRVTVLTRSFGHYTSAVKLNGYTIIPRSVLSVVGVRTIWDILSALRDVRRCQPRLDVLLCYSYFISGLIGVLAQELLGIPAAVSIRGSMEYRLNRGYKQGFIAPYVFRRAKSVIVQTPHILEEMCTYFIKAGKSELVEIVQDKTSIVPNGIDLLPQERSDGSKVLYIGRLIENKGIADLIEAMKEQKSTELIIVGDGPDRSRLETMANGSLVTFTGRVTHDAIPDFLRQARVLVLPSHRGDGLPNVIMESMAYGVPVISTNTAGIPDIVQHEQTGFIYEPGDISQLRVYIKRLLSDDEIHRQLGENSMQKIQSYSWEIVTPQIEKLLIDCASSITDVTH